MASLTALNQAKRRCQVNQIFEAPIDPQFVSTLPNRLQLPCLTAVLMAAQSENSALRIKLLASQQHTLKLQSELDRHSGDRTQVITWGADETLVWFGQTFSFSDRYIERFAALVRTILSNRVVALKSKWHHVCVRAHDCRTLTLQLCET